MPLEVRRFFGLAMRRSYSLRLLFGIMLGVALVIVLIQQGHPTGNATFNSDTENLRIRCRVTGKEAQLHRVTLYDNATDLELWRFRCKQGHRSTIDVTVGDNGEDEQGQRLGIASLDMSKEKRLRVEFFGSYVPWWPPALSAWRTVYRLDVKDRAIAVVEKRDFH